MATLQKAYRLDTELLARIDEWADAHQVNQAMAVRRLLAIGLDSDETAGASNRDEIDRLSELVREKEASEDEARREIERLNARVASLEEQKAMLGDHLVSLKESVSTLTAEVHAKNEQIRRANDLAEHEQILQAAHVAGSIGSGDEVERTGFWGWVKRRIEGR